MDVALLLSRLVLAVVFLVAGGAKLADRRGSIQAMRDFGVPERLAMPAGIALPLTEIAVAILLVPTATARWGALGALALLLAFVAGIGYNLARGNQPDCHCFGQLHSEPAGLPTLARNGILSAVAAFLLVGGWDDPGPSVVGWLGDLSGFEGVMLAGGVIALALIAVEGWALFHLLQQNGRLLLRLDALEEAIESGQPVKPAAAAPSGPISGLRVGTPAPSFELPNLAGAQTSLSDLMAPNTPTMLVFSDPGCGPCNALMPEIGRWQDQHAGQLTIALVSRGDLEANRSKAGQHGIRNVLLQKNREIAEAYETRGTPSAVLVRPNLTIGSSVAAGAEAIRGLVATATTAPAVKVPMANGNGSRPAAPDLIGKPAPDTALKTLDGAEVALASHLDGPTALLFWNPGCGFCQRMLDDLKALEADPPAGAPKIVVVSTGEAERNRAQGIQSTMLLDQGFATGRQFGASGTPSAVLVDAEGKVASTVAVGGPATLALMRGPVGAEAGD
jgi:thiol-disulfide isomerase/thioredoxin